MCIAEKCYFYETKQAGDIFLDLIDNKSCVLTTFLFFFSLTHTIIVNHITIIILFHIHTE